MTLIGSTWDICFRNESGPARSSFLPFTFHILLRKIIPAIPSSSSSTNRPVDSIPPLASPDEFMTHFWAAIGGGVAGTGIAAPSPPLPTDYLLTICIPFYGPPPLLLHFSSSFHLPSSNDGQLMSPLACLPLLVCFALFGGGR